MAIKNFSIKIKGRVQGVGFRPFIYKLAAETGVNGYVRNGISGVDIEIEGDEEKALKFIENVKNNKPALALIERTEISETALKNYCDFQIIKSDDGRFETARNVFVSPDTATCRDCENDIFNKNDRRYLYPFTNCTNCGPRYTIIEKLPYDRIYTVMNKFPMCDKCLDEYENPADRRFHAQPNACPDCGPGIYLIENLQKFKNTSNTPDNIYFGKLCDTFDYFKNSGAVESAIKKLINLIETGSIAAILGLGGFHIACRADDDRVIEKLRNLKNRPAKPFAMMAPDIETIKNYCEVSEAEEGLLKSPAAPIVLLKKKKRISEKIKLAKQVAPENYCYGFMLPYTPLHKILMAYYRKPLIMTSGNLSDEPICYKPEEAFMSLSQICGCALIHNRPILIPCDDSVMASENERIFTIRPARGISPYIFNPDNHADESRTGNIKKHERHHTDTHIDKKTANEEVSDNCRPAQIFAAGNILKNTISINLDEKILVSQFIGDMDNPDNYSLFEKTAAHIENLYNLKFTEFLSDMHPDSPALKFIEKKSSETFDIKYQSHRNKPEPETYHIQHHYAHALSVMAENKISDKVIALSFDGTGFGTDSSVWGGEFLVCTPQTFKRAGHFENVTFHNYDNSVKLVSNLALAAALCFSDFLAPDEINWINNRCLKNFSESDKKIISAAHSKNINCVKSSSLGRIFDIIAVLCGFNKNVSFEGEAAVYLESAAANYAMNNSIDIFNPEFYGSDTFYSYYSALNPDAAKIPPSDNFMESDENNNIIIKWRNLFKSAAANLMNSHSPAETALAFHISAAKYSVETAATLAKINETGKICLSGGVFFNRILLSLIMNGLRQKKLEVFTPKYLSFGDSAISAGQCYYSLNRRIFKNRN